MMGRVKKLYTSKASAERAKDRQAGSNRITKVKGGYYLSRIKKK